MSEIGVRFEHRWFLESHLFIFFYKVVVVVRGVASWYLNRWWVDSMEENSS